MRIGHLILDDLWGLARILREDDDLDVGEVGNGVEGGVECRVEPPRDKRGDTKPDEEGIAS